MCGVFTLLNNDVTFSKKFIKEQFEKIKKRGPENSVLVDNVKSTFGFHRLAINGLSTISNQPFFIDDILLICNGEIYNYKELYQIMGIEGKTQSDCEVIIYLYKKYGIEQTLQMLDGVFSFILLDNRINNNDLSSRCFVARDPFGIRPLFIFKTKNTKENIIGFASEMKVFIDFHKKLMFNSCIIPFTPGTYSSYYLSNKVLCEWKPLNENITYFIPSFPKTMFGNKCFYTEMNDIMKNIRYLLVDAVIKRCVTTERPVAALLSGGLDSSLIAALVSNYYNKTFGYNKLETYSIGLHGSEDLKHAKIVADYIGSKHTEIIVTEKEMFDAIPEVIYNIESYDTTTVRASIGNYLIGKYISQNSKAKVVFNGDGADEVCGGYLYMNKCPNSIEFDKETRFLLSNIHLFDVLRSDRCISNHGLEPRTPFLDKSFVNYYLSIPTFIRNNDYFKSNNSFTKPVMEKYLLRESFCYNNCYEVEGGKQLLPDTILWRQKEAFSDGVSNNNRSLFQIIQENIPCEKSDTISLLELEKNYYKSIFIKYYPNQENIIPFYWMPKYTSSLDPSARTLDFYNKIDKKKTCVLMFYDDAISDYGDINYKLNKKYCDKYSLDLILSHEKKYDNRHPAWERLPMILKYISEYEYLIWIDADAFFYSDAENIMDIIEKNKEASFIFSKDFEIAQDRLEENINTGIFIIKNTKYSYSFIEKWAYDEDLYIKNSYPHWWDQGVLMDMYDNNVMDIQNNSICLDFGILQHFNKEEIISKQLVLHLAGTDKETRINISKEYWNATIDI
jgi:asparagine synthase (glutamine-hydrolysing)